nr:SWIM zinc finger family protein [Streptomyces tendae]
MTTRLRGRLDQAVASLATTPVDLAEDGTYGIRCGADAWVTLAPGPSGTITSPDQARCTCLLSPRCLHRAAALAASPVADVIPPREPGPSPDRDPSAGLAPDRDPSAGPGPDRGPSAGLDTDPSPEGAPSAAAVPSAGPVPPAGQAPSAEGASLAKPVSSTGPALPTEGAPSAATALSGGPAPAAGSAVPTGPAARAVRTVSTVGPVPPAVPGRPSAAQVRAAGGLWTAASAVLAAGAVAAGAVPQAELLRAAHTARLAGLHRAEGAALAVVRHLRATRDPQGAHRAHRADELVAALRELLLVTHRLKAADPDPELVGGVPHNHRPDGALRLYGVCREPVVGPGGAGGVVTHLVDDTGRWYTLRDVGPGGPARARRAGTAHVAVRSFLSDHERLSRGGLVVTGAVVAPDGRLLAERGVRATFAAGRPWADAVAATAAPDRPGSGHAPPLTGCDVRIVAAEGEEVLVRVLTGDAPGPTVRLVPAHRHPALAHTANLRRLGACPGLEVRVLGRVDPGRVTTLRPLAVGPVPGAATTLRLPQEWRDRADLGYDTLADAHFPAGAHCPPPPRPRTAAADARPVDSPLRRIRDLVELAVTGGRRAAAEPARDGDRAGHVAALRRGGFATGADLFAALGAVAARRPRDAFGRPARDDQDQYAAQWLATAVYLTGTEAALARGLWHR